MSSINPKPRAVKRTRQSRQQNVMSSTKDLSQFYESDDEEFNLKAIKINPNAIDEEYSKDTKMSVASHKRRNAKSVEPRNKSKKPTKEYVKGKHNLKINPISLSKILDSKDSSLYLGCCVTCSNRNCIRAVRTNNMNLLKQCINARKDISSLNEAWSIADTTTPIQYAVRNNNKDMLTELLEYFTNESKNRWHNSRAYKSKCRLQLTETGHNSEYMVGVRVRKLNTTRGNKMGNNAFIFDDVSSDESTYSITNDIVNTILLHGKDPTLIDYIKSISIDPTNPNMQTFHFDFESNLYKAVQAGNKTIAAHLVKQMYQYNNYGFNALHSNVLNAESPDELQVKVKTSLTKKANTNLAITPVHICCINPDARYLEKLVELGCDWNCLDLENKKPIHYAAACESEGPLNYLISLGALIDEGDKCKTTPLMIACRYGRIKNAMILIDKGASLTFKDRHYFNNAFQIACAYGHTELAKQILNKSTIDVNAPGKDRMTALSQAAFYGHYDTVTFLVDNGAKVTRKDKFKRTPLINAIRGGHSKIVSYLLSKGSEYDFPDSSKNTPIHYACAYGWMEILEMLLQAGANPTVQNDWKVTAMEIAFLKNHFGILRYLLDKSLCDVNTELNLGMRLLHYSFMEITDKSIEEIRYFVIDKQADVNVQNFHGEHILHMLARFNYNKYLQDNPQRGQHSYNMSEQERKQNEILQHERHKQLIKRIFDILQDKTLNINVATKEGKTPLQIGLETRNYPFMELFIQMNPKLNFQDTQGVTLLHLMTSMVYGDEDERKLFMTIMNKVKELPAEECEIIGNAYDSLGYTPLLKLMKEYKDGVVNRYNKILNEEREKIKMEKRKKGSIGNTDKDEDDNEEEEKEEEEENEDEDEEEERRPVTIKKGVKKVCKKAPSKFPLRTKMNFGNINSGFNTTTSFGVGGVTLNNTRTFGSSFNSNFNNNNNNNLNNITLTTEEEQQAKTNALIQFNSFLDDFLLIIKSFINIKANPFSKVAKLQRYRPTITPSSTQQPKPKQQHPKPLSTQNKCQQIEQQYNGKDGKKTLLMFLMSYPYLPIVNYFIKELKLNINDINLYRENCLFILIKEIHSISSITGDLVLVKEIFELLLMNQININQIDWKGNTMFLELAKLHFNVDLLTLLSANGADVNKCNKLDENALIYYVRQKQTEKVRILLNDFKVNINAQNIKKRTCMHYLYNDETTSTNMDDSLSDLLLSQNPNLNIHDISGRTPLHYLFIKINKDFESSQIDPISSLTKLLEYGNVDIHAVDIYGNSALHYAAQRGCTISMLTLFEQKVNIDLLNKEGNSPLAYALMFNQQNAAILLIQQGATIEMHAHVVQQRSEKQMIKEMLMQVKKKHNYANAISQVMSTTLGSGIGVGMNVSKINDLTSNFDLNTSQDMITSQLVMSSVGVDENVVHNTQKIRNTQTNDVIQEEDDYMEYKDNNEENDNDNDNEDDDNDDSDDECLSDDDYSSDDNYNNTNNMNNQGFSGFGNNYYANKQIANTTSWGSTGFGGGFNNRFGRPMNQSRYYNNNNNNANSKEHEIINNKYFISKLEKEEGIKLFRICIKNDFQGLTFLFLSKNYPLMKAIEDTFYERQFYLSKKLLVKSPRPESYCTLNEHKQNLFHILAKLGSGPLHGKRSELEEFFDILYSKTISLTLPDDEGNTPLHYAASNHFENFCKFVMSKVDKNILNIGNIYSCTPFINAIKGNNIASISNELVQFLFTKNVSIIYEEDMYEQNYKCTPLLHVVRYLLNHTELITNNNNKLQQFSNTVYGKLIQRLLENGASLNERDSYDKDCLMYCAIENNFKLMKFLIEKDKHKTVNKSAVDNEGKTVVSYNVALNEFGSYENTEMLKYLLDKKFNYSIADNYGHTPLELSKLQRSKVNYNMLIGYLKTPPVDAMDIVVDNSLPLYYETPYPYEQHATLLFEESVKNAPPEKRKKVPNLNDYKSEEFELYYDEANGYWDASLTKVNIQNGIYGEYMFYFIQLVHDKIKHLYIVTTQFGRIGETGANQRSPFNSIDEAKDEFNKIFKSKTGNVWYDKNNFVRQKGKYMMLAFNDVRLSYKELLQPYDYTELPKCSLIQNKSVESLLKSFTDQSIYFKALRDSGVNTEFFNLNMLNKALLVKASGILKDLLKVLEEINDIKNKQRTNPASINLSSEHVEKITELWNSVYRYSSSYYELIPKSRFANRMIEPFGNINEVKNELKMIDNLAYVERAVNILLGAQYKSKEINPLDYIYNSLQTLFIPIDSTSKERQMIEKYIKMSQAGTKVVDLFKVYRKGEKENNSKWDDVPNHMLLFHGTKIFNFIGIFSNGLKIAPAEAPSTGYLFGKGLYFADMFSKSINYCDSFYDKETKQSYSHMLICEVAVGEPYIHSKNTTTFDGEFDLSFLKEGYHSLKAKSYRGPNLNKRFVCNDGVVIPIGEIVSYDDNKTIRTQSWTQEPEYVVYDTSQVVIRYLVKVTN